MGKNRLILERLEERILLAADPVAAIEVADTNFINEDINFTVSFDNESAGTDVGYQPHVDVVVEKGIKVSGAKYLTSDVTLTEVAVWDDLDSRWEDGSGAEVVGHPQDPTGEGENANNTVGFIQPSDGNTTGDIWYSVQLPFGSFAHDQPKVAIDFTAKLDSSEGAVVGTPLGIKAMGNFAFGDADALNNPATDAPVQGSEITDTITPTVWTIDKSIVAPESETATGPSFPRTWKIEIDIADGETVTDIDITDVMPNNLVYVNNSIAIDISGAESVTGQTISQTPTAGQVNNAPDNDFLIEFDSVKGDAGKDIIITYQAYVNDKDANLGDVIDPLTGDDSSSINNAAADGSYSGSALAQITDTETLEDKSIAIQKSVAIVRGGGATIPGAVAEYTLEFQISDYFSFDDLVIDDLFSDGLRFDNSFDPTFTVSENGTVVAETTFGGGNFDVILNDTDVNAGAPRDDGSTDVQFRLSAQLNGTAVGSELSGDQFNGDLAGDGGTTGTIKFRVIIQEDFSDTFVSGDNSVDMGDVLTNTVSITGNVKDTNGFVAGSESDDSAANLTIDQIQATKSIYAIDGNTGFTNVALTPGETVTYRIRIELASADAESFVITDFLPLPILTATTVTSAGSFVGVPSAVVPTAGNASFGEDHTLPSDGSLVRNDGSAFNGIPTITTNATNNTVQFDFGTFDDNGTGSGSQVVDILFTVAANDEPFGDGLFLTNQALVNIGSTNGSTDAITEIVQIEVEEPELILKKGIVSTNAGSSTFNPGTIGPVNFDSPNDPTEPFSNPIASAGLAANPIDSDLTGVDAGDLVKFAVVLESIGQQGAFDLLFNDQIPDGFELPLAGQGLNFTIHNGVGTELTFVDEGGGALLSDALVFAKFFSTADGVGVRVVDDVDGAIAAGKDSSGTENIDGDNIIIITYDLQAKADINPATVHTGTAELVEYAVQELGTDFTDGFTGQWDDAATVTALAPLTPVKTLLSTSITGSNNNNTQAVIGETLQYSVTITLPEGEIPVAQVRDFLDDGLTFVSLDSVVASGSVSSSIDVFTNTASFNPGVTGAIQEVLLFDFGTLTNSNTDNGATETLTLTYTVQVENIAGNQNSDTLNNRANFQWDANNNGTAGDTSNEATASDNAANITVIEPQINTSISAVVGGSGNTGDIGDTVVYTITLTSLAGRPEAFDASFEDIIPSDIDINLGGVTVVHSVDGNLFTGGGTGDFELAGSTVQTVAGRSFNLAEGETVTITVTGTVASTVSAGQTITNSATTTWTSIDNAGPNTPGDVDGERIGTVGVNDYTVTQSTDILIAAPAEKTIVSTSEAHTIEVSGIENLAIGEIVRYRLQFKLPESTSQNIILKDNLPDGLQFLNDGTAKVAFVANQGGISSSDSTASGGENWSVAGGASVVGNTVITPTFDLTDENISSSSVNNIDTYASGTDVYFKLGDLTNSDSDGDAEYVIIEFNAIALNNPGSNDAGDTLDNNFELLVNGASVSTSSTVSTRIAEPVIDDLAKTVTVTPSDAGDTITYQYVFSNTALGDGATTAFDIKLTDILDSNLDLLNDLDVTFSGPVGSNFINSSDIATDTVDVVLDKLAPGETATITVIATVKSTAPAGVDINSTANLTYTSLPGGTGTTGNSTGSDTPDVSGTNAGERDGSGSNNNDYNDNDTVTTTLSTPTIDQLQPVPSEYAIGDTVTYDIIVTLPEGETQDLLISDALPSGLSYVSSQIITTAAASGGLLGADFNGTVASPAGISTGGSGDDVSWNFGDTTTTDNNNAGDNQFLIRVTTLVENEAGNQDATVLIADADISWTNPNDSNTDNFNDPTDPVVTIVEPILTVTTNTAGVPAIPSISDTFQFITSVDHTGTSTVKASDMLFSDTMPSELKIISIDNIGGTNTLGLTTADFTIAGDGSSWTLNPGFDLELADDFSLTYTVEILDIIDLNQGLSNDVNIAWDSRNGTDANARDGSDGSGLLNDYVATADVAITTNNLSIDKVISATDQPNTNGTDVVIGETITYELTINVSEGATSNVVVNDTLPQQLSFISGSLSVVTGNPGMATQYVDEATSLNYDINTRVLTVNLGDIGNPGNGNATDDKVTLRYQAVVENTSNNQSGDVKSNNVIVTSTGGSASDSTDALIIEPELAISLTVSNATPIINETIQYTLAVDHTTDSETDAFDLTLTNLLADPDLTITSIDSIGGTNAAGLTVADFVITSDGSGLGFASPGTLDLSLADDFILVFSVKVSGDPGSIGNVNDISVDLAWTSTDGGNSNERDGGGVNDYSASINQNVTLLPVPTKPALPVFVFDASHNDAERDEEYSFFYRPEERSFTLPPLPIFPIFSGATEPGMTLSFKLYNEAGAEIGSQTVMADTGGNWMANFPGNIMFDQPHSMKIEQTASVVSNEGAGGFNLRTYFSPAMNEQLFFSHAYNVDTVFSNTASASLQAIHQGLNNPFNLGGGGFYAYEYLSSSSTTTQGI